MRVFSSFRFLSVLFSGFVILSHFFVFSASASVSVGEIKQFKVSAYYSPLPGQKKYVSGSYSADIRMNGNGVKGADGTPVYVGMISAPSTYPFNTRIQIDGLGIGTVHDRGGAIYAAQGYDRLDIWMGYGDAGRIRAINWGMRNVKGKIVASTTPEGFLPEWGGSSSSVPSSAALPSVSSNEYFHVNLSRDEINSAAEVEKMQKFLQSQGFFDVYTYGYFGRITEAAVVLFQMKNGVISSQFEYGAGVWGPKTRAMANKLYAQQQEENAKNTQEVVAMIEQKNKIKELDESIPSTEIVIPMGDLEKDFIHSQQQEPLVVVSSDSKTKPVFSVSLWRGKKNQSKDEVKKMQKFLSDKKIYKGTISGKFSRATEQAVFTYQVQNNIVNAWSQNGAGVWGPMTRKAANK